MSERRCVCPKVVVPFDYFYLSFFLNDLPLYKNSKFGMYADDFTLHAAAKTLEQILNNDVECISKWCRQNKMAAITEKAKCS